MATEKYLIKHHYANDNMNILEIKRTDLSDDRPKSEIYRWIIYIYGKLQSLALVSQEKTSDKIENRTFDQGILIFKQDTAVYRDLSGYEHHLNKQHNASKPILRKILVFLTIDESNDI